MIKIGSYFWVVRTSWCSYIQRVVRPKAHHMVLALLSAYSTPVPRDSQQILLLILLCFITSCLSAVFLYIWLFHSLQYNSLTATVLSTTSAVLICSVLVLVHPIRCILTIIIPTLGTKQGRRLLLSTCFMIMALTIIPNILKNLRTIFTIFRCISQHTFETVLNSTDAFKNLTNEMSHFVNNIVKLSIHDSKEVNVLANVDNSIVSNQISEIANKMKKDFETVESLFKDIMLVANRVLAGCFVLYMLSNGTWYLRNYLTDISFDNKYITQQLEQLAQTKNITDLANLANSSSAKLIKSTGFKLSRKELGASLFRLLIVFLFALLTVLIITTDHIVFQFSVLVSNWVDDLPALEVIFYVTYDTHLSVNIPFGTFHDTLYTKEFPLNITFFSAYCKHPTSPPDSSITAGIAFIYCILFAVIFMETYAQRLCRKISALFYRRREEERVLYLFDKIQQTKNQDSSPSPGAMIALY
ncbi:osteoclast stimulatory transmembrane protein [Pseudophryne corroboree]|uniref:osteoclast stimulatory transmembrane protein n=1 Tax=Pseudophryne corroboree TaxID=495146 RepID=UPI0030818C6D